MVVEKCQLDTIQCVHMAILWVSKTSRLWGNRVNAWSAKCLSSCVTKGFPKSTNFEWNISEI